MPVTYKSNLLAIANALESEMDAAAGETINDIGDLAQQLVPVDTGFLRDSKVITFANHIWRLAFTAVYAVWVEFGTARSAAQPFLTPAVRAIDLTFRFKARIAALIARNRV